MSDVQKFGYLVPQFPGQTHIFFWREIEALEKLGAEPVLFSTRPPPKGLIAHQWSSRAMTRTRYLASMRVADALAILPRLPMGEIVAEARREGAGFIKDVLVSVPAARRLAQLCRAEGITHIHVHSCGRGALIAALAARAYGISYSLSLHGLLSDYGPGQGFKWRGARFASVITQTLRDTLPDLLGADMPEHLAIQPMGVDTDRLKRTAPYRAVQQGEVLRLFSCGRLNVVKGHQDVMQAVRLLLDGGQAVQLEIAGEDDAGGSGYRHVLEQEIVRLGVQDHVRLLGAIDADAVAEKLMAAHIFVLASWHEPLGVAYMEAMSCEVPTIGTDAGGVRELITDDVDGILAPPKDPATLAQTIAALVGDSARAERLAVAGRARVVAGFGAVRGAEMLLREMGRTATVTVKE